MSQLLLQQSEKHDSKGRDVPDDISATVDIQDRHIGSERRSLAGDAALADPIA